MDDKDKLSNRDSEHLGECIAGIFESLAGLAAIAIFIYVIRISPIMLIFKN